jgi:hypothetical protein
MVSGYKFLNGHFIPKLLLIGWFNRGRGRRWCLIDPMPSASEKHLSYVFVVLPGGYDFGAMTFDNAHYFLLV